LLELEEFQTADIIDNTCGYIGDFGASAAGMG
jgi:hypothetical protein